ncbi:MAG: Fe-S cluster assembly protein NifU [Lentisphaeria bacterium]|nr:Fe-S cluster assembly protein NifU [Lentisphaeria bacterium]
MWNYTEKVMDHFLHPRNVGDIKDADAVGEVGNITCGDALKLFLKLDAGRTHIEDVKFQTFGCASAIASASALTELIRGQPLSVAENITNDDIAAYLGSLPEEKMHCSVMGMEALQAALANLRGEGNGTATSGHGQDGEAYDPSGLDRVVCYCFSVTERHIREVVEANGLRSVEQVTNYCKAGGGCGGCRKEIQAILDSYAPKPSPETGPEVENKTPTAMTNLQKMMKVQALIEGELRPGLQADGGDLELVDIDGDTVLVRLKGACAGCPGAHTTLKRWVEARLREEVLPTLTVAEA